MSDYKFIITPVDRFFFRENRPFNFENSTFTNIRSIFPPSAFSVVGAIRAYLARLLGWDGVSNWDEKIQSVLGDGLDLAGLDFYGPYLVIKTSDSIEPLFPCPLNIIGNDKTSREIQDTLCKSPATVISAITKKTNYDLRYLILTGSFNCSLGNNIKLAAPVDLNFRGNRFSKHYLSLQDYQVLINYNNFNNDNLRDINPIKTSYLWSSEIQAGNKLTYDKDNFKSTGEDGVFSRFFIRPKSNVAITMCLKTSNDDLIDLLSEKLSNYQLESSGHDWLRLGGEGKAGFVEVASNTIQIPKIRNTTQGDLNNHFFITFITPARLGDSFEEINNAIEESFHSKIVTACVGRAIRIGGWSTKDRVPLKLLSFIPAGSTYFLELKTGFNRSDVLKLNGTKIGDFTQYGYGQFIIGRWNGENNAK